ncbi:MAG TPA: M10 family metallopeptidase C-terminal domain-containing protein, partial [Methyloceanibacter sp.]|nr:M10 family metallopeptidase C-terminal domain-containing protein [Methyloceanibacter sp.]
GTNFATNEGTINGRVFGGSGVDQLENFGVIHGDIELAGGPNNTLINAGTVDGSIGVITPMTGNDNLFNLGMIIGAISLDTGDDLYDGRSGTISGSINMGAGADRVLGGDGIEFVVGGDGRDTVDLGGGEDTFFANAGADDGDDTIDGGLGSDTYDASSATSAVIVDLDEGLASGASIGMDQLHNVENAIGSSAGDTLIGNELANLLRGQDGADFLFGFSASDTIEGNAGADMLVGGLGRDFMSGGGLDGEMDLFDFNSIAESGLVGATRDRILDFEDGVDKIDLSTIDAKSFQAGNQAFKFIGAAAFTSAGGQIRASVTAQGNTLIQLNIDKDKLAEMSILVVGEPALTAADFVL